MAYLTAVVLERIPCELVGGLLDRLVSPSQYRASVDVDVGGYPRVSLLCQQVGWLCRALGDTGNKLEPNLNIQRTSLSVSMGGITLLALHDLAPDEEEQETGRSRSSQLVEIFLAEVKGPSFKAPIELAFIWCDTVLTSNDGIKIMDHFFPNTCRLRITVQAVLDGVVEALTETKTNTGGFSRWHLQKLSELEIKLFGHDDTYDGLVDMAIERTRAAALPRSSVSPIMKLTLGRGSICAESLRRLDEMGIEYISRHVTIIGPKTRVFSADVYDLDDLL